MSAVSHFPELLHVFSSFLAQ